MNKIGLYGGSFKPPHYGHFSVVKQLSEKVDEIEIYISNQERQGRLTVIAEQSVDIWKTYGKYISVPVSIKIAPISPILSIYERIEKSNKSSESFIVANTVEDLKRYKTLQDKKHIYSNAEIFLAKMEEYGEGKLSATTIRECMTYFTTGSWVPEEIPNKDEIIDKLNETFIRESRGSS